jgi:phage protein D
VPEGAATQDQIYRARPTLRFAGQPDERASELVQTMVMSEGEGGLRSLELGLSNWASTRDGGAENAFDESSSVRLGAEIEVYGGEVDRPLELFKGRITGLEARHERGHPPELMVFAEDALVSARLVRRSRVFRDKSPADVVREVASALGLQPVIAGLTAPVRTWAQLDETDLAFLRRLLLRFDADVQIVQGALHVSPRAEVRRAQVTLSADADLRSINVCADLADQVTSLSVRGWDVGTGAAVKAELRQGTNLGPGRGREGSAVLGDAIGDRPENIGNFAVGVQEEAQALAEAAFDRRARGFVRAVGVTEGNPNLRVGVHLTLTGLGTRFDNDYYVASTRHCFDLREGYRTEFVAECAYLGGRA